MTLFDALGTIADMFAADGRLTSGVQNDAQTGNRKNAPVRNAGVFARPDGEKGLCLGRSVEVYGYWSSEFDVHVVSQLSYPEEGKRFVWEVILTAVCASGSDAVTILAKVRRADIDAMDAWRTTDFTENLLPQVREALRQLDRVPDSTVCRVAGLRAFLGVYDSATSREGALR